MNRKEHKKIAELNVIKKCDRMNYILLIPYTHKNAQSRIYLKCNKDGYEWDASYNNFINKNTGCHKCGGSLNKTQKEVNEKILNKCKEMNYTLINDFEYKNCDSIFYLRCNKDDYEWPITYNRFINIENVCPKCAGQVQPTQEEAELNVSNRCRELNYLLTKPFLYQNENTILHLKCFNDNYEWPVSYNNFISNKTKCAKCMGQAQPTQEEAENLVLEKCRKNNYILVENFKYTTAQKTNLILNCTIHSDITWKTSYHGFINGRSSCKKCGIEKRVNVIIEKYGENWFKYVPFYNPNSIIFLDMISEKLNIFIQHALNKGEKKFRRYWVDGYVEEYNICIEWDEKPHYGKTKKEKDLIRENYIKDNFGCMFVRINEKEFLNDVDNQLNIIVNKIKQIINERTME